MSVRSFSGKLALVTGATARAVAHKGALGEALIVRTDVALESDVRALAERAMAAFGRHGRPAQ